MCMQDLWIARHTVTRHIQTYSGGTVTLPGNPSRLGILLGITQTYTISNASGVRWVADTGANFITAFAGQIDTQTPPGVDVVNLTAANGTRYSPNLFHLRDYGSIVQETALLSGLSSGCEIWVLEADVELMAAWDKMPWSSR